MAHSYSESFPGSPRPEAQPRQGGGWILLLGGMLAAAGLGFAGYLYAVPYRRLTQVAAAQAVELLAERADRARAVAEGEKLKTDLGKHLSAAGEKAEAVSRHRQESLDLAAELKTALGAVGAVISLSEQGAIEVTFPVSSIFDMPVGTGVSGQGETALKILGAAVQKTHSKIAIKARLIPTAPPRAIAQFKNIGEFAMLRAVRAALSVANTGVRPESIAAAGASPLEMRKGKPAMVPDLLEVEIERE
jgi:hypothetical protein